VVVAVLLGVSVSLVGLTSDPRRITGVPVRAVEITGPEADELYARQVERRPGFAEYKRKTSRWIPVIALEPVG
jgi:hypothetical protein